MRIYGYLHRSVSILLIVYSDQTVENGTHVCPVTPVLAMSASKTRRSHPSRVTIDAREAGHSHLPSVSLRSPRPLYSGHPLVSFLPQQSLYTRVALQTLRTRGSWYSWSSSRPFLRDTPAGTTGAGAACSSVTLCSVTISSVSVSTE